MTEKQTLEFVFVGSNGGKMRILQQSMKKTGNIRSTMPRLREGKPDHVVQFDEHG